MQNIDNKRTRDLSEEELTKLREEVDKYTTEGDLRRYVVLNIKRLKEIQCYRGRRHINVSLRRPPRLTVPFFFIGAHNSDFISLSQQILCRTCPAAGSARRTTLGPARARRSPSPARRLHGSRQ